MMAFIRVIALALALSGSSAWSSHPSESARNQYEAREDKPQPQLLTEATDHRPEVHMSQQGGFIKNSTNTTKQLTAPDLQVGCGDGFIKENLQENSEVDKNKISRKRVPWGARRKRSYTPWSGQVVYSSPYQSINVWRAPTYQLSRPYFVPIYGIHGRVPIYFPPQPLLVNPGVPADNPMKKPFEGPTYLPPVEGSTPASSSPMTIEDRFNGGDNRDEMWDWGDGNQQVTQRPTRRPTQRPFTTTTDVVPTRRTRPPGAAKVPPLIHNPTDPEGSNNIPESSGQFTTPAPPTATVPTRPPSTPPSTPRTPARPNEPSRCVWAIISCCSSNQISYECFDQRGCTGPFWDDNPCNSEFAKSAISAALNYYNKK